MENGVQALSMAFAVFIFVLALAISLSTLTKAKDTADIVLFYSDRETFQEFVRPDKEEAKDGGRIVGIDTVIATVARCKHENFAVKVKEGNTEYSFDYTLKNPEDLQNDIYNFIEGHVNLSNKYRETYVEVTLNGITHTGEDGTTLEENVGKKIYITYTRQ